ncbi:hypothetical protein Glove_11g65 [Diversispora epigaea]|uniref:Crinkler effector protein N-terminal domain-containing protein n=1 Tax=Diversispora epigaea TaxID=1348612 RepID=A0A397JP88_9GLOM|nr:hypothetical protein Glove_11g65 [Diversispora epigaea]
MFNSEITTTVFTEASRLSTIQNEKKLTEEEVVDLFKYFTENTERVSNAESALSACLNDNMRLDFLRSLMASTTDQQQIAITEGMKTFAKVLPWNKLNVIPPSQSIISLPDKIWFFNNDRFGSKIFVRKAYKELWDIIYIQYPERDFLITGNPGTGKTFFNIFLLYILVGIDKTVVFQENPDIGTCYKFSNGTIECTSIQSMRIVLDDPQVYYLLDNMEPQIQCKARKIAVFSPNRERYKKYEKWGSVDTRIMPIWDLEELETLHQSIHFNTNFTKLRELYTLWGGIPTYVIEKVKMESSQSLLESALATVNFDRIIGNIGNFDSKIDVSHRLIHITCNEKYLRTGVTFASKWVADNLLNRFELKCFEKVKSFLLRSGEQPAYSELRRQLFESYAHKILVRGNETYQIRNLEDGKVFQKHFIACEHVLFTQLSDINRTKHKGKYCQPTSKTFCAIDAFILGQSKTINMLFQMTVSKNYPIKTCELKNIMNIGTSYDSYEFYFVVPPEIWNDFIKQSYVNLDDTNKKKPGHLSQITQYVLKMPLYL